MIGWGNDHRTGEQCVHGELDLGSPSPFPAILYRKAYVGKTPTLEGCNVYTSSLPPVHSLSSIASIGDHGPYGITTVHEPYEDVARRVMTMGGRNLPRKENFQIDGALIS
jgi:hypothetical protein